jgi:hypothetical protein
MKSLQNIALLIAILAIIGFRQSYGQTPASYYFDSEKGNDNHKICDIEHPYCSISKANSLDLKPGDQMLFKRGGYWRGQLHPKGSGTALLAIKIGCYGKHLAKNQRYCWKIKRIGQYWTWPFQTLQRTCRLNIMVF